MIFWSAVLPGKVQQRTGIPSRVTAIAITTCGRSSRWSLECPNSRAPSSSGQLLLVLVVPAGEFGQLVGDLGLPVGGGGVHEDDVHVQVEQVRDRVEDLGGDLLQRVEQEVHRPVGGVVGEPRAALDEHPLGHPPGRRQLRGRLQRPLRDQREDHPLDRLAVEPPPGGDPADRRPDLQPFPQPVQHPRPAQPPGVQHLHLAGRRRRRPPAPGPGTG